MAEIFQHRGSYEYAGAPRHAIRATGQPGSYIQDAWGQGLKIGVIASPDHGGGLGKAAVWAREKTRAAILEGIRARRTFGTTAARIQIDFRVNGRLMGEVAQSGGPVMITADVRSPQADTVDRNLSQQRISCMRPRRESPLLPIEFTDQQPIEGPSFYYLRVTLEDGEIAWTSPVWLEE